LTKNKNALSDYVRGLYQHAVLPLEEEERLSRMIQAGDRAALDKLVRHNLRFVVSVVKESPAWHHGAVPFEDLIAMGNEGLLKAAQRWVPRNGARFATYAKPFIVKGVRRALDNEWSMIRIPVNMAEEIRRMKYIERSLSQELGREPTTKEVADRMVVHEKRVVELQDVINQQPVSLESFNQEKFQEESDE
jgi:RNA polymerase primary sigma factor